MSDAVIPLFPLATVLFPGQLLPLHVFEPRYRQLVEDLLAQPDQHTTPRAFGVVSIRDGDEVGTHAVPSLRSVGTLAVVQSVEPYDDGRFDVVTTATRRFRLDGINHSGPYLRGDVTWIAESVGVGASVLAMSATTHFRDYRNQLVDSGVIEPIEIDDMPDNPGAVSYVIARGMVLDQSDRQSLLEQPDDAARLRAEISLLRRENTLAIYLPSFPAGDLAHTGINLN